MQRMFRCLSLNTRKKETEDSDSSGDDDDEGAVQEQQQQQQHPEAEEKTGSPIPETADETEAKEETNDGASEADPDRIQVVVETVEDTEDGSPDKKDKKTRHLEDKLAESARSKQERNGLVIAQIALAEESARLRRKEKREKKRMELSKYLGINAWKCDQKFLLNYGQEPEDIRERVIIIRKRNVKKERQRRIDEFVLRAEMNSAARRQKKKA